MSLGTFWSLDAPGHPPHQASNILKHAAFKARPVPCSLLCTIHCSASSNLARLRPDPVLLVIVRIPRTTSRRRLWRAIGGRRRRRRRRCRGRVGSPSALPASRRRRGNRPGGGRTIGSWRGSTQRTRSRGAEGGAGRGGVVAGRHAGRVIPRVGAGRRRRRGCSAVCWRLGSPVVTAVCRRPGAETKSALAARSRSSGAGLPGRRSGAARTATIRRGTTIRGAVPVAICRAVAVRPGRSARAQVGTRLPRRRAAAAGSCWCYMMVNIALRNDGRDYLLLEPQAGVRSEPAMGVRPPCQSPRPPPPPPPNPPSLTGRGPRWLISILAPVCLSL